MPAWTFTAAPPVLALSWGAMRLLGYSTKDLLGAGGTILSAVLLLVGWEFKLRKETYQRVVDAIARLVVAWEGLKRAACLSRAVETNLILGKDETNSKLVGKKRLKSIGRIEASMRDIGRARWPMTPNDMTKLRRKRYRTVMKANSDVVGVFESSALDPVRRKPFRPPLVDHLAIERMNDATGKWDESLALAVAATTRWPVLQQLIFRCDDLINHWLIYALNDPYYRAPDADSRERNHAFYEADKFICMLRESVATRTVGQTTWRVLLLRLTVGRRTLATLDAQNELFH
jgi:hypothetical protein